MILILGSEAVTWQHFSPVFAREPGWRHQFLESRGAWHETEPLPEALRAEPPALVLAWSEYRAAYRSWIEEFRDMGVPCLHFVHGMIEWRCHMMQFDPVSYLRPSVCDVIACAGPSQARLLRGWGNAQPLVVVGLPRLDPLAELRSCWRPPTRPRILIATANALHTESQRQAVTAGLRDLRDYFRSRPEVEAVWRLDSRLATQLGLRAGDLSPRERPLREEILGSSALIGTMSTCLYEAMILGLPTACLEYEAVPQFFRPVWNIARPEHVPAVVPELLAPPDEMRLLQQMLLEDAVGEIGTATETLRGLIHHLIGQESPLRSLEGPIKDRLGIERVEPDSPLSSAERRLEVLRRSHDRLANREWGHRSALAELEQIKRSRAYRAASRVWSLVEGGRRTQDRLRALMPSGPRPANRPRER